MNRVLLSTVQQLKCNFCTQWFSVPVEFANLQKYSLNACHKCLGNFQYHIVDPTSFQIYDVVLVKTGMELMNKKSELDQKFQMAIKIHEDFHNLSKEGVNKLREEDERNCDLKAQIDIHTQPIKETMSQIYKKLIKGMIKHWTSILNNLQKSSIQFDKHRQNIIKTLSDRYYNFRNDTKKLLNDSRVEQSIKKFKQIADEVKAMTSQKVMSQLKNFIAQFFGISFSTLEKDYNKHQNKQNLLSIQNIEKTNIRKIREKLMSHSRVITNSFKIQINNKSLEKSTRKGILKQSKKSRQNSAQRSLGASLLRPEKSQRTAHSRSPRSVYRDFQLSTEKPNKILDQYRNQISKLLTQKEYFESYMPTIPQKNQSILNKTYGEKCLVEYLVELKMKTTLNENLCELINQSLSKGNLACYLKSLDWKDSISIIRFVKVKLQDANFDYFLNWLKQKTSVQILVLCNNFLTQLSVQALYSFCLRHPEAGLKKVYLGSNYIRPSRAQKAIQGLHNLGIQVSI